MGAKRCDERMEELEGSSLRIYSSKFSRNVEFKSTK